MNEEMRQFFNGQAADYDAHTLGGIAQAEPFFAATAALLPVGEPLRILDLGCGTGLELGDIFERAPQAEVTAVDMAEAMLARLEDKFAHKKDQLTVICADFLTLDLPEEYFDAALTVQTLHHFSQTERLAVYEKIYRALKAGGCYLETDYLSPQRAHAHFHQKIGEKTAEHFYHDGHSEEKLRLLRQAGFAQAELVQVFDFMAIWRAVK